MSALSIGLSGLQVNQQLLQLTGQNIANAETPEYHNEVAQLVENVAGNPRTGAGVDISEITRDTDASVQDAVTDNTSQSGNASTQLTGLNQLQAILAPGSGTLHDSLEAFFNQLTTLSATPNDPTQQQLVVSAAGAVTSQLNSTAASLQQMSGDLVTQAQSETASINSLTSQIAQLNQQIQQGTLAGSNVNGLEDQRDQAMANLAQLVNVQTVSQPYGAINVFTNGNALVLASQSIALNTTVNKNDQLQVTAGGSQPIDIAGGNLGGTLTLANTTLPAVQSQLNTFTQALATQFDEIQGTGLGLAGSFTSLTSQRPVASTTAPLADAQLAFPAQAGDLYITVTNQTTGQRSLNQIAVDPNTESLADVASAISAIPNMQAVVDAQSGTINMVAAPGYQFDFSGNLSTSPDSQTITGSTTATIDGQYSGSANGTLNYTFTGSGTIGSTPNLAVQVTDDSGTVLGTLNVGQGYTPGTDITGPDGVNINLSAGTANSGDTFSVNVAGNPDSAHLLSALGLNSFFVGTNPADLQVNPAIQNNQGLLATSTTGQSGDGSNVAKMVNLQNQNVLVNNTQSLQTYLENIIGSVGTQTNQMQTTSTALTTLGQQLNTQLQSATGVDTNQALTQLVQYQQAYQLSAQFVSTVNQMYQDLYNILAPVL